MAAALIKKTVTGEYGYHHRDTPDLTGKTAVITGGTNGIGLSFSRTLYTRGASIIVIGHSASTGKDGVAYIKSGKLEDAPQDYQNGFEGLGSSKDYSGENGVLTGKVEYIQLDLENLNDVAKVAKDLAKLNRLDIFAGIAGKGVDAFSLTKEGLDSHLAMNNLSHHLLLSHLLPVLTKTSKLPGADVRIVNMSSELHRPTILGAGSENVASKFTSIEEFRQDIGQANLYFRSKLGVLLFTKALVQRHLKPPSSIIAYATHPGAVATGQVQQYKPAYGELIGGVLGAVIKQVMRKPDDGALSILWAATAKDARGPYPNGQYFTDPNEIGKETAQANDLELIDNFYDTSDQILRDVVGAENVGKWIE